LVAIIGGLRVLAKRKLAPVIHQLRQTVECETVGQIETKTVRLSAFEEDQLTKLASIERD